MRILSAKQMREADRRAIEEAGIPSVVLMENAGRQVVAAIERADADLPMSRVTVLSGPGNNGGDGFVIARVLYERDIPVRVGLLGRAREVKGDAKTNLTVLNNLGIDVVEIDEAAAWELHGTDLLESDLIIDALFGTGLREPLTGLAATIVDDVNASEREVISVDVPSGLSADTADVPGPAIHATMTVALGALKLPLVLPPAERLAGTVVVADIGIPEVIIDTAQPPHLDLLTRESVRVLVEPRSAASHKGTYGHVLIVAGSPGKTGAAHLAAMAALRSGAGLVTVATPASSQPVVAALGAEYMTLALSEAPDGTLGTGALDTILAFDCDIVAIGPGLGTSTTVASVVHGLVARSKRPLVLDADALNVFEGQTDRLVARAEAEIVITPHPGEMARLVGLTAAEVQAHRLEIATEFAATHGVHVVLKGHRTLVVAPDGETGINLTGNPGMATAGSGDVLLGVIAAWMAQRKSAVLGTSIGVYLHGLAGDLAADEHGETGLIAGDIVAHLGKAAVQLTAPRDEPKDGS
jgi:NAD(P)H-hydrate epimerase